MCVTFFSLRFFLSLSLFICCALSYINFPLSRFKLIYDRIFVICCTYLYTLNVFVYIYLFPMNKSIWKNVFTWSTLLFVCFVVVVFFIYYLYVLVLFLRSLFSSSSSLLIQMRFLVYVCKRMWMVSIEFFFVNFGHSSYTIIAYLLINVFFFYFVFLDVVYFYIEILTAKR